MAKNMLSVITEMATKICDENGVYLYEAEYQKEGKNQVLRVYIDQEGGVNIDQCEAVSRALSDVLDKANVIQTAYHLEVSSPGAERKLSQGWHYEKVIGKKIEVSLYAPLDGKKNFLGILQTFEQNVIYLIADGTELQIPLDKVATAKLYFDINEALKAK